MVFVVVGAGPAGCILLASLPDEALTKDVVVVESGCVGGDLARYYGGVLANLTTAEMIRQIQLVPRWATTPMTCLASYAPDACPPLSEVCRQLRILMIPLFAKITMRTAEVRQVEKVGERWRVDTSTGPLWAQKVALCVGAVPKQLDLPLSNIPLEVALHEERLRGFVQPGQRVVVFGTAHSGTLVLRNLQRVGCKGVGIYRGDKAFSWARDGDPNGIKQESAVIADEIMGGIWGPLTPSLLSSAEVGGVIRACMEAEAVVYAIGFQTRGVPVLVEGTPLPLMHDSDTGKIAEGLWGFGIGFPSGVGRDVGFGAFATHIQANVEGLMSA
jgi:hypothetical protein